MGIPDWLPNTERVVLADAGAMLPGSKWSLLLHTDEIDTNVETTIRVLREKSAASHFVYDWRTDRLVQLVSLNRAAKSLKSGGNFGKTNSARVIQVEIVGRAADSPNWSALRNQRVGGMIARIHQYVPFRLDMPLGFFGNGAGWVVASKSARQRMSWFDWYRFDAICGHQHAPNNDHWDPGAINVGQILAAARGGVAPPPPNAPGAQPVPQPRPQPAGPALRLGNKGDRVKALQERLNTVLQATGIKGAPLDVDGNFGPGTQQRVKDFQSFARSMQQLAGEKNAAKLMAVDGVAGPTTDGVLTFWVDAASAANAMKFAQAMLNIVAPWAKVGPAIPVTGQVDLATFYLTLGWQEWCRGMQALSGVKPENLLPKNGNPLDPQTLPTFSFWVPIALGQK